MSAVKVASRLPGRLRLRGDALRRPRRNQELRAQIAAWEGVTAAEGNPATGGLLLRYDPARLDPAELEARALALIDPPPPAPPQAPPAHVATPPHHYGAHSHPHRFPVKRPAAAKSGTNPGANPRATARHLTNIAMLATMAGSLAALAWGKKLHALIGMAHVGFLALHLLDHRRKLIRDLTP
ncbi:MAG TPA: hypothetical protein PKZ97_13600 [Azospirillaceae bacterium]|nr:hypothetical protein [Azospirillaceae bacterium]HRQ82142.1 hypothetical protein [Azospirillaceae bacterium]